MLKPGCFVVAITVVLLDEEGLVIFRAAGVGEAGVMMIIKYTRISTIMLPLL